MKILAEISVGELYDKITILNIKTKKISDVVKLQNINLELDTLKKESQNIKISDVKTLDELVERLQHINEDLWDIENFKRECESKKDFGDNFIKLSRDVHFKNDIRAQIKKEINLISNSLIVEEKEYSKY